jgi:hypothetical protein
LIQLDPLRSKKDGTPVGFLESAMVHDSVAARIASGTDRYAPFTLPEKVRIVPPQRQGEAARQADSQDPTEPPADEQPPHLLVSREVRDLLEDPEGAAKRIAATEHVWDLVWRRRLIYFWALAATIVLAVLPWAMRPTELERLCSDDRCIITGPIAQLKILVPSFLEGWVDGIAEKPLLALALIALIVILLRSGKRVERSLRARSHATWEAVLGRSAWPRDPAPSRLPPLWRSPRYRRIFRSLKWTRLPSLVALLFLLALLNVMGAGLTQLYLLFAEPRQAFCSDRGEGSASARAARIHFKASSSCTSVAMNVVEGHYYELRLRTSPKWTDAGHRADLANGADLPIYTDTLFLYRRVIGAPWLKPLIEIRSRERSGWSGPLINRLFGARVNIAAVDFCEVRNGVWGARFKAPQSGQISIMLNDAALPFAPGAFYGNNRGEAVGWIAAAPENRLRCVDD